MNGIGGDRTVRSGLELEVKIKKKLYAGQSGLLLP